MVSLIKYISFDFFTLLAQYLNKFLGYYVMIHHENQILLKIIIDTGIMFLDQQGSFLIINT